MTSTSLTNDKGYLQPQPWPGLTPHHVNTGTESGGPGTWGAVPNGPAHTSIWPYRRGGSELKCVSLASVCPINSPSAC